MGGNLCNSAFGIKGFRAKGGFGCEGVAHPREISELFKRRAHGLGPRVYIEAMLGVNKLVIIHSLPLLLFIKAMI